MRKALEVIGIAATGLAAVGVVVALGVSAPVRAGESGLPNQDRDPYLAMNQQLVAHGCPLCHGADYARVGPAMRDVALFHANDGAKGAAQLKESILNGSKGRWGTAIMPPQRQVTPVEVDKIVATILALKDVHVSR